MHGTLNTWREWGWFGLLYWYRGVCRQDSPLNMWTWSLRGKLRLWTCPWNLWNSWHLSQNGWSSWGGQMYLYILSSKRSFLTTLPIILTSLTVVCVSSRHLLYPVLYSYCLFEAWHKLWEQRFWLLFYPTSPALRYPQQPEECLAKRTSVEWIKERVKTFKVSAFRTGGKSDLWGDRKEREKRYDKEDTHLEARDIEFFEITKEFPCV